MGDARPADAWRSEAGHDPFGAHGVAVGAALFLASVLLSDDRAALDREGDHGCGC